MFLPALMLALVATAWTQPPDSGASPKQKSPTEPASTDQSEASWFDKLDREDRAALDKLTSFAPPAFPSDLTWIGNETKAWKDLRGKVVVIQSWTSKSTLGRKAPVKAAENLEEIHGAPAEDIHLIALHTPEGADGAAAFLKQQPLSMPVVIDAKGAFCDALGIWKRPVNVVIDRNGAVRYAGLNHDGLIGAVTKLLAEPVDAHAEPKPMADEPDSAGGDFPPFDGAISHAKDIRGKKAPEFHIDQWMTQLHPEFGDKVVIVDFWATWCGPCVASIPHMNELAEKFKSEVAIVGVSDEKPADFKKGLEKIKSRITLDKFKYGVALDPARQMYGAIGISAIPHAVVMSKDWTVRWQGHPATLDEQTLRKIVQANSGGGKGKTGGAGHRWQSGKS